jgi:hypothetical protein
MERRGDLDLLHSIDNKLDKFDEKLDALKQDFNDYKVTVEGRLTKVETHSSWYGAVFGAITGAISAIVGNKL